MLPWWFINYFFSFYSSVIIIGRGYSSYGSGYLSYAKVGQCGYIMAGNRTTM